MTKILLLSGMTPDDRIFHRLLPQLTNAEVVRWIRPIVNESLSEYANRLSRTLTCVEPLIVCGVSFGGIVARELAPLLNAKSCVQIASIASPHEFPPWFRVARLFRATATHGTMKLAGTLSNCFPRRFRSTSTLQMTKLTGELGHWYRWAARAAVNWQPSKLIETVPVFKIHGDRDRTFPLAYTRADHTIHGGGHTIALSHSSLISSIIKQLA
ncbi:MAG: hypothetical protein U0930_12885 [Pirellulales bacterium]